MKLTFRFSGLLAFTFFCMSSAQVLLACGTERWNVKVAQDKHNVYFFQNKDIAGGKLVNPQRTSIDLLQQQPYPFPNLNGQPPKWSYVQRAGIAEFRIWTIEAFLFKKKNEKDEDYHLVLRRGDSMIIAEIPSAGCVEKTPEPLKSMIIQARADFDEWFGKQTTKTFNQRVCVNGVGFFDRVHGAEGTSPNGIELHPVIKITFLKKTDKCK